MPRITCYDGVGCIGGNKILLEDGGTKLFFDFGRNFGAEGALYDEFMQPKTVTGLYEHIQMGFLPPVRDLYRADLESSLADAWGDIDHHRIGDVQGVLVSHAHVDHIGAIGFLRTEIPVYCSPMTAAISRALQDTGESGQACEYCYYLPRVDNDDSGLSSPNYRTSPHIGRKFCLTEDPPEEFRLLWTATPGSRDLEPLELDISTTCDSLKLASFPVDHSLYGALAWAVQTSAGWVVYTGDLRMHGGYRSFTRQFVESAAKLEPVGLVIEGTRIEAEESAKESDVLDRSLAVVRECSGLVVADFGPRNVERLLSFLEVARETGRKLAILPKDAYLLDAMRAAGGAQQIPDLDSANVAIYWEYSGARFRWQNEIRERYSDLVVGPREVSANQGEFICCFSYWDVNELAYIRPVPGSAYIYSSCEPFSEEMEIDARKLRAWIDRFGLELYGAIGEEEERKQEDPFHVSGHASGHDLFELVRTIRPKKLIPVHTEHPELYRENVGDVCDVIIPERGVPIDV